MFLSNQNSICFLVTTKYYLFISYQPTLSVSLVNRTFYLVSMVKMWLPLYQAYVLVFRFDGCSKQSDCSSFPASAQSLHVQSAMHVHLYCTCNLCTGATSVRVPPTALFCMFRVRCCQMITKLVRVVLGAFQIFGNSLYDLLWFSVC